MGGTSTLAIYLQRKKGLAAGHTLMFIDALIFINAFAVRDGGKVLWSIPGAIALNLMIILNHKPGRYMSV